MELWQGSLVLDDIRWSLTKDFSRYLHWHTAECNISDETRF